MRPSGATGGEDVPGRSRRRRGKTEARYKKIQSKAEAKKKNRNETARKARPSQTVVTFFQGKVFSGFLKGRNTKKGGMQIRPCKK